MRLTWATICDPGTACIGRQGSDGVLPGLSPSNRVRGRVWGSLRYLRTAWGVVNLRWFESRYFYRQAVSFPLLSYAMLYGVYLGACAGMRWICNLQRKIDFFKECFAVRGEVKLVLAAGLPERGSW